MCEGPSQLGNKTLSCLLKYWQQCNSFVTQITRVTPHQALQASITEMKMQAMRQNNFQKGLTTLKITPGQFVGQVSQPRLRLVALVPHGNVAHVASFDTVGLGRRFPHGDVAQVGSLDRCQGGASADKNTRNYKTLVVKASLLDLVWIELDAKCVAKPRDIIRLDKERMQQTVENISCIITMRHSFKPQRDVLGAKSSLPNLQDPNIP